jgi:hypothetical protein
MVSGFRRDVHEICRLLACYAAASGNPLPTFRDNLGSILKGQEEKDFLNIEGGTDALSRNVGEGLPLDAA